MLPDSFSTTSPDLERSFLQRARLIPRAGVLGATILAILVSFLALPMFRFQGNAVGAQQSENSAIFSSTSTQPLHPTGTPAPTSSPPAPPTGAPAFQSPLNQGLFILSLSEGGYSHLFAYHPQRLPLTRLTDGPWDDITPAISPDRTRLAFASNRAGSWDLYLLDLPSGETTRVTDTPEYDAAPAWSPDGQYLAYESYVGDLEIFVRSLSGDQTPLLLSNHPGADFAPTWSPQGREIAFVSTRSGEREIWLANLDQAGEEVFTNLSRNPQAAEAHPAWSPDGMRLAWSAVENGSHNLYIREGTGALYYAGSGDWPAWSPDGCCLLTMLNEPNRTLLTAYSPAEGALALPPIALPGPASGLAWGQARLPETLPDPFDQAARATPAPLWLPALASLPDMPTGRQPLTPLAGVQAPYPLLHDLVDESFQALRGRVAIETGWDLLASLENAFVPITASLSPGLGDDWLYTGRAFAITPLPANAGWLVIMPEDFGGQRYWRIFAKTFAQDGTQGKPLQDRPWDFNARYGGDPLLYDQGGALAQTIPAGYWVDVTELAGAYGWERLPALSNWRAAYPAARFNEFVMAGGQEWLFAMLEIYPAEALVTPTALVPPTLTPTPTPRWRLTPLPAASVTPGP